LRLAYLAVTNTFAMMRTVPMSDRDKDTEILVLRHQLAVLERQLSGQKVRFTGPDRAFLAALLHRLTPDAPCGMRLLVHPETVFALAPCPSPAPACCPVQAETAGPAADGAFHPQGSAAP
jgi:hypothetical protein